MSCRTRASSPGGGGYGDYKYIVLTDGTTIAVRNNKGTIVHSGTVAATEINWALANLTAGRTNKERVAVQGYHSINALLSVYSYTSLDLTEALLFLANNTNTSLIANQGGAGGNIAIDIFGGILDGNKAQNAGGSNINLQNCTETWINRVKCYNADQYGMVLGEGGKYFVDQCIISTSGLYGIIAMTASQSIFSNNYFVSNVGGILNYSNLSLVTDNVFYSTGKNNEAVIRASTIGATIKGNQMYECFGSGILLDDGWGTPVNNVITDNLMYFISQHGIYAKVGTAGVIADNIISGMNGTDNTYDGVHIASGCTNYQVTGNKVWNAVGAASRFRHGVNVLANDCLVEGNEAQFCASNGVNTGTATHPLIKGNKIQMNTLSGVCLGANTDYARVENNISRDNGYYAVLVANANCDNNAITNNNLYEGSISDAGTNTRAWLNYDPRLNAMLITINAPTVVGGGGGALP